MSDTRLCYFKFQKKTETLSFYRYKVTNTSHHVKNTLELNNQVRSKIISNYKNNFKGIRLFAYSDNNENYIYTYHEIKFFPDLSNIDAEIELIDKEKIEMPVAENTDLYEAWIKYYVYSYMNKIKKYDCHEENHFYANIANTPKNRLNIILRRDFFIKAKVMPDGTSYIGFDISTDFYTNDTIYDYMERGIDIVGMKVRCLWQDYKKTYTLMKVLDESIMQSTVNGKPLYDYWKNKKPDKVKRTDPYNTKTVILSDPKYKETKYIPQSLRPVFERETVASKDSNFSKDIDEIIKMPMDKRLEIMREFLNDLNSQSTVKISTEPTDAESLGYYVYDAINNAPGLLTGNNRRISFDYKYQAFSGGFYRIPEKEIVIGLIYFEEKRKECHDFAVAVLNYLNKGIINGNNEINLKKPLIPMRYFQKAYSYKTIDSLKLKEIAMKIEKEDIDFVICFVSFDFDEEGEYMSEKSPYNIFKKALADIRMPSQMISTSSFYTLGTKEFNWRMQNIALGILSKSGGTPWIFSESFNDVDCFIGLDVSTQQKGIHYPACSVCFDGKGNFLGYYTTTKAQQGEKIGAETLEDIFDKMLIEYNRVNGDYPKHIVIHRDGFSNESDEWYEKYFSSKSIIYDIVEVKKNISERLLDMENISNGMNPDAGICIIKENEAVIVTNGRNANYGGAPRPLKILHKHGNIPIHEIAEQIYALSELHVGSMKSTRLPMTTYYADRICKAHDYIPKDRICYKLYFI